MKWLLILILILLAIVGIYLYFTYPTFTETGQLWNPLSLLNFNAASTSPTKVRQEIQQKLSEAKEEATKTTQAILGAASEAIEKKVEEGIAGAAQSVVEGAKAKLAESLGIAPANKENSYGNEFICATVSRNVGYTIQNPFSPPKDFSFRIDWGNGESSEGSLRASDIKASVTHHYEKSGTYINTFQITSGNESLSSQRKVCVE